MIIINPPPAPRGLDLVTTTPEERAVEAVLRIVGVPFACAENVGVVEWLRLLAKHGTDATFIVGLASPVAIEVHADSAITGEARRAHVTIDGAEGLLNLAALLASWFGR